MRLLLISIGTVIFVSMALISIRFYGQLKVYQPYDHELLNSPPTPWIFHEISSLSELENSPEEWIFLKILTLPKGGAFIANGLETTPKLPEQIAQLPLLENILKKFPNKHFLLDVQNNEENADLILQGILERSSSQNRVMIHSEFDVINESIKKLIPRGVYSLGSGEKARLKILAGIGLESAVSLNGDFVVSELHRGRIQLMDAAQRSELNRRFLKWIAPEGSTTEFKSTKELGPDAWISKHPDQLRALLLNNKP